MRKILLTTALLTAMSSMPVLAQSGMPADFVAPEGYQSTTADTLTFQDLMGATVYDVRGESIGDISDFVMEAEMSTQGASATTTKGATATTNEGTTSDSTSATTESSTTATDGNVSNGTGGTAATDGSTTGTAATDSTESEATGTAASDGTTTATDGSASGTASTDGTMAEGTATDGTATEVTDTVATDGTGTASGTDGATAGTDEATDVAADGTMSGSTSTGDMASPISGQVSHAIIDVGGFLGMGTHTVAIPIEALQVYRGTNASDVRVYLPWNEDQLKQIPEYVEGDQSTLGTMQSVSQ